MHPNNWASLDEEEPTGQLVVGDGRSGDDRLPALSIAAGPSFGRVFRLQSQVTILGRGADAHVALPYMGVSRAHAKITSERGICTLTDLGSKFGTFVGETRLNEPVRLHEGNIIRLGIITLLLFGYVTELDSGVSSWLDPTIHDRVTGTYNRRFFEEKLHAEWTRSSIEGHACALIVLEIDGLDDICGSDRASAARLVTAVARLIRENVWGADLVARLGGKRFAVLEPRVSRDTAMVACERIRGAASAPVVIDGAPLTLTFSIGVSSSTDAGVSSAKALWRRAEEALERAKQDGGDAVVAI